MMLPETPVRPSLPSEASGPIATESGGIASQLQSSHITPVAEFGGREGPEPTRFGDWEKNGRCIDF